MSELFYKNLQKVENIKEVYDEVNNDFICEGVRYSMYQVPQVRISNDSPLAFMQKGNKEYFSLDNIEEKISFTIVLEENVNNMEIENIYMSLIFIEDSFLDLLANPNIEQLSNLLKVKLREMLERLPYNEKEIEIYENMIDKYVNRVINEDIKPIVNTQAIITQIKEKVTQRDLEQRHDEERCFVKGEPNPYKGKIYTKLSEIAKDYNINYDTLSHRVKKGMTMKEMIETPVAKRNRTK